MALSGKYKVVISAMGKEEDAEFTFNTDESGNLTGTLFAMGMEVDLESGSVNGNEFEGSAKAKSPMGKIKMTLTGTMDGDNIEGALKARMGGSTFKGSKIS